MVGWLIIIFLSVVGLYDLYRIAIGEKTISQKVHAWTGKWGDAAILVGIMALVWIFLGHEYFATILVGVTLGHFFWNKD